MGRPLLRLCELARRANQPAHLDPFAKSIPSYQNFLLSPSGKSPLGLLPSRARSRGVSRSSRHVGRGMRWTLAVRRTYAQSSGRRSRVVLMSRCWHQLATMLCIARGRWQPSRSPGRARSKPLKPFVQGMPECFGGPVATMLVCFFISHTRLRVQSNTWHSLRPPAREGKTVRPGRSCRGNAGA